MEKEFETEVLTRLTKIETKLDDYSRMRDRAETAYSLSKENEREISDLQDEMDYENSYRCNNNRIDRNLVFICTDRNRS